MKKRTILILILFITVMANAQEKITTEPILTGESARKIVQRAFEQAEKVTKSQKIPFLIEFMISSDELVLPMVKNGSPISDMIL